MSRQSDYAIVLMTRVAAAPARTVMAASDLAAGSRLSLPMVSKILKVLARAGLLDSHRGSRGGYSLARPAAAVSVAEVIEAIEGPIAMTECVRAALECEHELRCPVQRNWHVINSVVIGALRGISLAEMTVPLPVPVAVELSLDHHAAPAAPA